MITLSPIKEGSDIMDSAAYKHQPVMVEEVLQTLVKEPGGFYLDATLGLGGHSKAILDKISAQGRLLGLDMDPEALHVAGNRLKALPGQFRAVRANFRTLGQVLETNKFFPLAGALFDLGVSSMHFDKPERGFSFDKEGPLDMRLAPDNPLTASTIINNWPSEQLALLLKEFGEEPACVKIARSIEARRKTKHFETTTELADFISTLVPRGRIHPATRTFMALRIAVNAELENLTRGLESVLPYLMHAGRLAVISFHSLEDRIVKNIFSSFVEHGICRYVEEAGGKSPILPGPEEIAANPRARSAKLRLVEKL